MTQSDHDASHHSTRRDEAIRRPGTTSRHRRGGDRGPYPAAPETTRTSPTRSPRSSSTRLRSRGAANTPTPATVWPAGPTPVPLDATWPTPILSRIVTSFSPPGGQVAFLPWPTHTHHRDAAVPGTDAAPYHDRTTEPDPELVDALATIADLDRTVQVIHPTLDPTGIGAASRPFWADLVNDPDHPPAGGTYPRCSTNAPVLNSAADMPATLDLIITSLHPEHAGDASSDHVAMLAARLLTTGGILAVLTHCDWTTGRLIDPTGTMVASAQNADLLYLQHIVALHTPVVDGQFSTEAPDPAPSEDQHDGHTEPAPPAPHQRIHSDLLVFANPKSPEPPRQAPADTLPATGDRR